MSARPATGVAGLSRTTASLLAARVLSQLLAIALTVLLASRLGLSAFGAYALVGAVVFVANVVTTFGTDMVVIRDIAAGRTSDRCGAAFLLQLVLSMLVIASVWAVTAVLPAPPQEIDGLRILCVSLLPCAAFSVCTAALRGHQRLHTYAGLTVVAAAAPLAAALVLVPSGSGVVPASWALLVAQVAVALAAWAACRVRLPGVRVLAGASPPAVVEMARSSASIGVLGMLGVVYQRGAAIAVALLVGPAATGWFAGASRILEASKTGHVALFTAVYPAMAGAHAGRTSATALRWSRRAALVGGAAISAALLLLGPGIVDRLYGPAFGPARSGLMVLALAVLPSTAATWASLRLLAAHRGKDTLRVQAAGLAVLAAAVATLVPTAGWTGACWAVLAADTVSAALMTAAAAAGSPVPWRRTLRVRSGRMARTAG